MAVTSKIRRQGGAAVMTIPPALLKMLELEIGAQVVLTAEKGKLVARRSQLARKRYSLAELLKNSAAMKKLNVDVARAQDGESIGHELT